MTQPTPAAIAAARAVEGPFFKRVGAGLLGPTLSQDEVTGCQAILAAMAGSPIAYTAYALATAYKETAHTMQPINEMGGIAYFTRRYDPNGQRPDIARQLGNTQPGDGPLYHGRGYVQLSGRANYAIAKAKLGLDLIAHPAMALEQPIAAAVMREGMSAGWFTGKSFGSFLPLTGSATVPQFISARRIINGQDCAGEIADYAVQFQVALAAGGWA